MRCVVTKVQFLCALGVIAATSVRASVLFYDNFQQFPSGTVLTETNYFPNIGMDANIQTNQNGVNVPTVTATNLLGSVRVFYGVTTVPYTASYRGDPNISLTNQDFMLTFDLWIAAVKSASHVGGIGVDMLTTNIDSLNDDGSTNFSRNPVFFINDGGQVYVFTNNADASAPLSTVAQIGAWSAHVGTVMTNALIVSFTSNIWSYVLNGVTLTNMPIPHYVTNIYETVGFEVFEAISGGVASLGNKFAFDDIELTSGPADTNQDVASYIAAAKGQAFEQLTSGPPSLSTTGWVFHSDVKGSTSNSLLDASLTLPGGSVVPLQSSPGSSGLGFDDQFTSQASLDATYPSSAPYTLTIDTADQGTFRPSMSLPADDYPTNAPQIVNFAAAQIINSATNFVLQWAAFTGGTTNDFITLSISDTLGNDVFDTPGLGESNALDGTVTSALVPGNTLAPGTAYQGNLLFVKTTSTDTNTIPGATGLAGFYKYTVFSLMTTAPPPPVVACVLAPVVGTNTINTTYTTTATVTTNGTPVGAVVVNFAVIAGPNVGNSGTSTTDGSGNATFSYSSAVSGTDTIQAAGFVSSLSFTGTATEVWLGTNIPPVAICHDVTVPTAAGGGCSTNVTAAQVDNGSYDPDGTIVSRVLSPAGPYSLGSTPVTLTVTDDRGATNSCTATITVVDQTPPIVTCPANVMTNVAFGVTNAVVNYPAPVATDNCLVASTNSAPPSGSTFGLGTNAVTFTAVDTSGNTNTCSFDVVVNEGAPQANLAVSGVSSVSTASLNNSFAYTFTVTNQGPQDATDAEFEDTLPAGLSYNVSTSSVGTCVFTNGALMCDLGTLTSGSAATVAVVVTATSSNQLCNTGSVSSDLADPVATNNSATVCVPVVIENLAVTAFKAPKKVTLSATKTNVIGKLSVTIQNRSLHTETITNLNELASLVTIGLTPLGTNVCDVPAAQVVPPRAFPIVLTSGKTLTIAYTIVFTCANDPLATTKLANHNDYQYLVSVNHAVLDGLRDSRQADDTCPHNALGVDPYNPKIKDKGCGVKNPDGTFGPVVTDIVDTRVP